MAKRLTTKITVICVFGAFLSAHLYANPDVNKDRSINVVRIDNSADQSYRVDPRNYDSRYFQIIDAKEKKSLKGRSGRHHLRFSKGDEIVLTPIQVAPGNSDSLEEVAGDDNPTSGYSPDKRTSPSIDSSSRNWTEVSPDKIRLDLPELPDTEESFDASESSGASESAEYTPPTFKIMHKGDHLKVLKSSSSEFRTYWDTIIIQDIEPVRTENTPESKLKITIKISVDGDEIELIQSESKGTRNKTRRKKDIHTH